MLILGCPEDPNIYPDALLPNGKIMEYTDSKTFNGGVSSILSEPTVNKVLNRERSSYGSNSFSVHTYNAAQTLLLTKNYREYPPTSLSILYCTWIPEKLRCSGSSNNSSGGYIYNEDRGVGQWILHATTPR